jgi:hypothetical protein
MSVIYNEFKSIADIKRRGEFFKAGKIIPSRILKSSNRKMQHCIKTGSNYWAFSTLSGYLIFFENNDVDFTCVIKVANANNCTFHGSPYSRGTTSWQGNHEMNEDDFIKLFNKIYKSKNKNVRLL